jgi:hypothetical protein
VKVEFEHWFYGVYAGVGLLIAAFFVPLHGWLAKHEWDHSFWTIVVLWPITVWGVASIYLNAWRKYRRLE